MNLHEKILKIAHELEEQQKSLQETESDLRLLYDRTAKLDAELQRLYSEKKQLEAERDSLRDHVTLYEEMIGTERANAVKVKETLEAKLIEVQNRAELSEKSLLEAIENRDKLISVLEEEQERTEQLQARVHEFEKKEAEFKILQANLEEQRKNQQEAVNHLKHLEEEKGGLVAEIERLKGERTQTEIERDSLKEKVKQHEEKAEAERSEAAKLKDALEARLAEAERKLGLQENDLSKVTQEKDSLIVLLRASRRISEEVKAKMAVFDEKAAELDSKKREFVARLLELDAKVAELDS